MMIYHVLTCWKCGTHFQSFTGTDRYCPTCAYIPQWLLDLTKRMTISDNTAPFIQDRDK